MAGAGATGSRLTKISITRKLVTCNISLAIRHGMREKEVQSCEGLTEIIIGPKARISVHHICRKH